MLRNIFFLLSLFCSLPGLTQSGEESSDSNDIHINEPRIFYLDQAVFKPSSSFHGTCLTMYNRWGELLFESDDVMEIPEIYVKYKDLEFGNYYYFVITGVDDDGEEVQFARALAFNGYSNCG